MAKQVTIKVKGLTDAKAQERAEYAQTIANNLTVPALKVLAEKSKITGISATLLAFQDKIG